jgi:hypothetical protein
MSTEEKVKLKHDFLNSIVVINSMTKSASSFVNAISKYSTDSNTINQKQLQIFLNSMTTIREQTAKLEMFLNELLDE